MCSQRLASLDSILQQMNAVNVMHYTISLILF
jgi:hypothetical protein